MLDLLFDGFFFPLLIFAIGVIAAGRIVNTSITLGAALILGFIIVVFAPWLIFSTGIDLITILAIILFGLLVTRYVTRASVFGSVTLILVAILVGGFLLQLLTGSSLAFR